MKFNKTVLCIEEIGKGTLRWSWDKGYRDMKKKEFKTLYHRTWVFTFPQSNDEYPLGRGTIIPFIVRNSQATTIKGIAENPHFIPADLNMFQHLVSRLKTNFELTRPKQTWWDKYGRDVILFSMIAVFLVSIILILKRVDEAIAMGKQWTDIAASQKIQVVGNKEFLVAALFFGRRKK